MTFPFMKIPPDITTRGIAALNPQTIAVVIRIEIDSLAQSSPVVIVERKASSHGISLLVCIWSHDMKLADVPAFIRRY